jgi:predicted N-acetyltransferase YhbS
MNYWELMTRMIVRKLQSRDLTQVKNLIGDQLNIKQHRLLALLTHLACDLILKLVGLDTIIGAIAQTNNGNIIGVVIARRFPLVKVWAIGPVVVNKLYRRSAIGSSMMKILLGLLKDKGGKLAMVSLGHTERHSAARRFFISFGFFYVKRVFLNRDQARHYVRMVALTGSFKENLCQEDLEILTPMKTCYVLLKEL